MKATRPLLLIALFLAAFAGMPANAQQNMADVIYGGAQGPGASVPAESNRSHVSAVQHELRARGYKIKVDGKFGPKTRETLKKFQRSKRLPATGQLDASTLAALGLTTF